MEYIPDVDKEQIRSRSFHDAEGNLKFDPPVFEQRYMYVIRILNHLQDHIKNVVEFGCSELQFFVHMKSLKFLDKIVEVNKIRFLEKATL